MKKLIPVLIVLCTVVVTLGAQLALVYSTGKGRAVSYISNLLGVEGEIQEIVEIDDKRYEQVDEMLSKLQSIIDEKQVLLDEQKQTNNRLTKEIKRQQGRFASIQSEMDKMVRVMKKTRIKRLQEIAKTYESTDPKVVASIFEELEDEECAELLMFIKERQQGKIIQAYTTLGVDEVARQSNAKRIAKIMKLRTRIVKEGEESENE